MSKTIGDTFGLHPDRPFLPFFVVYNLPDFIGGPFVVRLFFTDGESARPTETQHAYRTLDEARKSKPADLAIIPRSPFDQPQVVESWL